MTRSALVFGDPAQISASVQLGLLLAWKEETLYDTPPGHSATTRMFLDLAHLAQGIRRLTLHYPGSNEPGQGS